MYSFFKRLLCKKQGSVPIIIKHDSLSFNQKREEWEEFIFNWNVKYPIDKWYRDFYKIRFNSEQHREVSLSDMYLEFREQQIYNDNQQSDIYIPNKGKYVKKRKYVDEKDKYLTLDDVKKEFEEMDLSKYDD